MKTDKTNTTRLGLSLTLLGAFAILSVVAIRLQATDAASDDSSTAGCCALHAAPASAASCHDASVSENNTPAPEPSTSCHSAVKTLAAAPAAPQAMKCCAMNSESGESAPAPHHH